MTRTACTVTVAALLAAVGACSSQHAPPNSEAPGGIVRGDGPAGGQDGDVVVALADCPPEVQRTINEHLDGGAIREIERTTDHGETLYEVDVAADGAFRGYEEGDDDDDGPGDDDGPDDDDGEDDDIEIPLSDVPQKVIDAARSAVPGIVFEEASVEMEDGLEVFELEGEADGVEYEIEVTAEGEVLEIERDDDEDDD